VRRALLAGLSWLLLTNAAAAFPQTYDTDASVYFLQLSINGCATPSAAFKAAVNAYVIAEKTALNWGNQDAEYVFATTDSCTAATNLAQPPLYKVTWSGSPTFTLQNGLNGDGATIFGDLGVNQSSLTRITQNNAHVDVWTNSTSIRRAAGLSGTTNGLDVDTNATKTTVLTSAAAQAVTDAGGSTPGLHFADRTGSTTINTGLNGALQSNAAASTSTSLVSAHVVVCEVSATTCANGINELFFGLGGAMNNEASHYTNVRNLLLALGVTGI
jgi:hypothetical protein